MKVQFQILLFIICLNLAVGLAIKLGLPGTEWVEAATPEVTAADYEEHFNATEIVQGWQSTPFSGIPVIGDIFSGLQFLWGNVQYLVDGFPMFLDWVADTYLTDTEARTAFDVIAGALRALYVIMLAIMVIEFISGRYMSE